jgi:hypothetical protein
MRQQQPRPAAEPEPLTPRVPPPYACRRQERVNIRRRSVWIPSKPLSPCRGPRLYLPGAVELGYLLFDGFLVNRFGDLTWDGTTKMSYLIVFP